MQTVTIQIHNEKAFKLLQDSEDLDILTVISKSIELPQNLSEKYKGVFTEEDAQSFNNHTLEMRKEWP